jgi:hypothetical protein
MTKRDREGFLEWRERLVCSACGGRDSRDGGDRETTPGRLGKELPTYDLPAGRPSTIINDQSDRNYIGFPL